MTAASIGTVFGPAGMACASWCQAHFRRVVLPLSCALTLLWFVLPFAFQPGLLLQDLGTLPSWMIPDGSPDLTGRVFRYQDVLGRTWYRLMRNTLPGADTHFRVDADAYPDGCRISWFSTDANILQVRSSDNDYRPWLGRGVVGSQYPRILKREEISPATLRRGIHLGLIDDTRDSVFLRITPHCVEEDAWHVPGKTGFSCRNSVWLLVASGLSLLTGALLAVCYVKTGEFRFALMALGLAFLLGAVFLERPFSGFAGQIDAGDDSYYLAYAQNWITQGTFFQEPTSIAFGARHVAKNHGLPGTGLFLAPAAAVQSLLAGEPVRRHVDLNGLRAMRLMSAGYSLLAMIMLCASFHLVRPRIWNVVFPSFLLWGTSLSKWTFQRCIFTHSIEMAFFCTLLFVLVWIWRKPNWPFWKGVVLGSCLGCAFLVRGEYLLAIPLVPLLLSRTVRRDHRFFLTLCAGYGVALAAFARCYAVWVGRISTGYGDVRSSQSQFFSSVSTSAEFLAQLVGNTLELFQSYWASGYVLVAVWLVLAGVSLGVVRRGKPADPWPLNRCGLGLLTLAFFLSNALFHTPLGMEWQHRYSLKLYPLALWMLWLFTDGVPLRWKRFASLGVALLLIASVCRQMQAFCGQPANFDAGLFAWTDEQLVLEGMRSPYGLSVAAGASFFAVAAIGAGCRGGRRRTIWLCAGLALALLLSALYLWAQGRFSARRDLGGIRVQYYDDADLLRPSGVGVQKALNVWNGHQRPQWNVKKGAYSLAGTGWLFAPTSAEYSFYADGKDGLRLYLDGTVAVDNW